MIIKHNDKEYDFTITKMNAYDSITTLGKISKLVAPLISEIDVTKVMKAQKSMKDGESVDLSFMSFLSDLDEKLLADVLERLVSKAVFNDIPVSTKDSRFKGDLMLLIKLAYNIVVEEYSDFLQSLQIDVS